MEAQGTTRIRSRSSRKSGDSYSKTMLQVADSVLQAFYGGPSAESEVSKFTSKLAASLDHSLEKTAKEMHDINAVVQERKRSSSAADFASSLAESITSLNDLATNIQTKCVDKEDACASIRKDTLSMAHEANADELATLQNELQELERSLQAEIDAKKEGLCEKFDLTAAELDARTKESAQVQPERRRFGSLLGNGHSPPSALHADKPSLDKEL